MIQVSLRWNLWNVFPESQHTESCFRSDQGCTTCWKTNLVVYKLLGCTGCKGIKLSWKAAKVCPCGRSGEAIGDVAASVAADGQRLNEPCREVEAWHHEESLGKVKVQPSYSRKTQHIMDASAMGWPARIAKMWSGASLSLEDKLYAIESGARKVTKDLWRSPEDHKWTPDIRHYIIYTVGVWFCFDLIVTVPWFFPLEVRKYFI